MSETNVLRMESVTMQFGGVVAVNDLSLDVPVIQHLGVGLFQRLLVVPYL